MNASMKKKFEFVNEIFDSLKHFEKIDVLLKKLFAQFLYERNVVIIMKSKQNSIFFK